MTPTPKPLTPEERAKVRAALGCTDVMKCPHMNEVGGGFSGERYRCDRCGESYYLDYEDMR